MKKTEGQITTEKEMIYAIVVERKDTSQENVDQKEKETKGLKDQETTRNVTSVGKKDTKRKNVSKAL